MTARKTRLFFDHVPKTAGTSVTAALGEALGEDGTLPEFHTAHFRAVRCAGAKRFLAGHVWFTAGEPLDPGWYYCTLLRDPVDRFLSQYWFNRAVARGIAAEAQVGPGHTNPQVLAASLDLADYVGGAAPGLEAAYANVQAIHYAQRIVDEPARLDEESLFAAAVASLEGYDLVGVYTDLQGLVDVACRDLGVPRVQIPMLNATAFRTAAKELPADVGRRLAEANRVDSRLLDWARQRFERARHPATGVPVDSPPPAGGAREAAAKPSGEPAVEFGTREVEVVALRVEGESGAGRTVRSGERVDIEIECDAKRAVGPLTVGLAVRDANGHLVYGTNSRLLGRPVECARAGRFRLRLRLQARLGIGEYGVTVALHRGDSHLEGCYHWIEREAALKVAGFVHERFEGVADLGLRIEPGEDASP